MGGCSLDRGVMVLGSSPPAGTKFCRSSSVWQQRLFRKEEVGGSRPSCCSSFADVAQRSERLICNQRVGGSTPSIGSRFDAAEKSPNSFPQSWRVEKLTKVERDVLLDLFDGSFDFGFHGLPRLYRRRSRANPCKFIPRSSNR
jgi:hypothetical protein